MCVAALVVVALRPATSAADTPRYDPLQALFDDEAHSAMADGDFARARHFFWRLLQIDPDDVNALREAGRCAQALGDFGYAERTLARVAALQGHYPDPELHYLRGEALLALRREAEARREFAQAELLLPRGPMDRQGSLWLARIHALRGELAEAEAIYLTWLDPDVDSDAYAEIMTLRVEAHILAHDWRIAKRLVRALVKDQPYNGRVRELLAWVLEATGDIDEELALRRSIADEMSTDAGGRTLRYGRALERAGDYGGALARYREARELGVDDAAADIDRMEYRLSPEVAAALALRSDPSGVVLGWVAGTTLPFSSQLRLAATAWRDTTSKDADFARTGVTSAVILSDRAGDSAAAGAALDGGGPGDQVRPGATAALRTRPGAAVELQAAAELGMPWRESASTLREGGRVHSLAAQLYATAFDDRLVLGLGGRARWLSIAPAGDAAADADVSARQLFAAASVDAVLQVDHRAAARGEILDEEMLWTATLASAVVVSYRHYELTSEDPFGARLRLVGRSSIDEVSAVLRRVVGQSGILGAELRGGAGYDWNRDMRLWRAGASLLISPLARSRLSITYDAASESGTGLTGRRHTGWVTLHVDL